jgi:hypothetical protein
MDLPLATSSGIAFRMVVGAAEDIWAALRLVLWISSPAAIICALAFFFVWKRTRPSRANQDLLTTGQPASATVRDVQDTRVTSHKNPMVRLQLEITPEGGQAYDATVECFVSRVKIPRVGDLVPVMVDPNDPARVLLVADGTTPPASGAV